MTIQDYNHPDCLHGFPEWTERQLDRVLSKTGCPSCQAEHIAVLQAKVEELSAAIAHIDQLCKSNHWHLAFELMCAIQTAAGLLPPQKGDNNG